MQTRNCSLFLCMGIIYSLLGWTSTQEEPDPVTNLTPKQVGLIQASWATAFKDRATLGAKIMINLFKKHPEYKAYFPFKDVPDDQLGDNMKFKVHCTTVVYALGQIIDNLNNPDLILAMLDKLAENHIKHGAPSEGFLNIQKIIEDVLRPITTDETFAAWSKMLTVAMTYSTNKMKEAKPN